MKQVSEYMRVLRLGWMGACGGLWDGANAIHSQSHLAAGDSRCWRTAVGARVPRSVIYLTAFLSAPEL